MQLARIAVKSLEAIAATKTELLANARVAVSNATDVGRCFLEESVEVFPAGIHTTTSNCTGHFTRTTDSWLVAVTLPYIDAATLSEWPSSWPDRASRYP